MSDHENHLCDDCLNDEYELFRHSCVHESQDKNKRWLATYRISDWPNWFYAMEDATLTFSTDEKVIKVICQMQVVGTSQGNSWEWSWGNTNLPAICKTRINDVFLFGKQKNWDRLTNLFLENDEYTGWKCQPFAQRSRRLPMRHRYGCSLGCDLELRVRQLAEAIDKCNFTSSLNKKQTVAGSLRYRNCLGSLPMAPRKQKLRQR